MGRYRGVYIAEFPYNLAWDLRSSSQRSPAAFWIVDPAETPFVLEHKPNRHPFRRFGLDFFLDDLDQFFLKASCSSAEALGCLRRGVILRHPWRASIR